MLTLISQVAGTEDLLDLFALPVILDFLCVILDLLCSIFDLLCVILGLPCVVSVIAKSINLMNILTDENQFLRKKTSDVDCDKLCHRREYK